MPSTFVDPRPNGTGKKNAPEDRHDPPGRRAWPMAAGHNQASAAAIVCTIFTNSAMPGAIFPSAASRR